ncbi:MAG TPA: hypothetical protein VNJ11_09345 [Bryobacteraceae bacterium]|nr:hypothetical protein [Bryobacteraceae bacterium]
MWSDGARRKVRTGPALFSLTLAAGLIWANGTLPEPRNLDPVYSFQLKEKAKLDYTPLIWRIRAAHGKLWLLWSSRGSPVRYFLASLTPDGQRIHILPMDPSAENVDITPTSKGFASLISRRSTSGFGRELILAEHDPQGNLLWQKAVPCGGMDALTSVGGRPALLCGDGRLRVYAEDGTPALKQTWGRRGTVLMAFAGNRIAVVDQATAQVLVQDLEANTVSAVTGSTPEIEEARRRNRAVEQELARRVGPEEQAKTVSLIVLDAASDGATGALLVFPHRPMPDRISVVSLSEQGQVTARYRCRFDPSFTPVRLALDSGHLALASATGYVYVYKF